jgi:GTP pyrophosphokinase
MKLTERFNDALLYAARLHADQFRKGNDQIPYIAHLIGVTAIALEFGADENQAIAALLHDAVEDQGGNEQLELIRQRFGETVAQIVSDCSDSFETPKPPWRARKEAYIRHLSHVSPASRLVSCADKVHNARSIAMDYRQIGEAVWDRFKGGRDGTLWYYRTITRAFQACDTRPIVAELERAVTELELLTSQTGEME